MYSNPGAFLLMVIYDAFERGDLSDSEAKELIDKLGYTVPDSPPEQAKIPG